MQTNVWFRQQARPTIVKARRWRRLYEGGFAVVLCFARALTKAVDSVLQRPLAPLLGWLIMLGRGCFFHSRAVHSLVPSHTVAKHTGFKVSRPCYGCFMMSGSDDIFHSES
jgi:hypothetical protein